MPIIKSAKKRVKVANKAAIRNSKTKRGLKDALKAFHRAVTGGKKEAKEVQSKAQSALDNVLKSKTLKVAVPTDYPPYGFVGPDMAPQGLDVEMAKLIAEALMVEHIGNVQSGMSVKAQADPLAGLRDAPAPLQGTPPVAKAEAQLLRSRRKTQASVATPSPDDSSTYLGALL